MAATVFAMHWLQALDTALFSFINLSLSNTVFDAVMPFLSGNAFFFPILLLVAAILIWKTGTRGLVFVALAVLIIWLGESLVVNTVKHAVERPRPYFAVAEAHTLL